MCDVPQWYILGPLLFLIYVNDMSAVVKNKLFIYADDSATIIPAKSNQEIKTRLSHVLDI